MKKYEIRENCYELVSDDNCFNYENLQDYFTEYFDNFDYIFGYFCGDKVRLKGFYESTHVNVKKYNDIQFLNTYVKDYCNYGCKTFLLKKVHKK